MQKMQDMGGHLSVGTIPILVGAPSLRTEQSQFMVCRICRVPLNSLTEFETGEVQWVHTRSWNDYDHEPDPVVAPAEEIRNTACDFCGFEGQLHWAFVGQNIKIPSGNTVNDYGDTWSACEYCAPMVQSRDYTGLSHRMQWVSKALKAMGGGFDREVAMQSYLKLWYAFIPTITERNYIGPRRESSKLNPRLMPKMQLGLIKYWKHPDLMDMTREAMTSWNASIPGVHVGDEDTFVISKPAGRPMSRVIWHAHTQHLAAGVGVADLYWISNNFTQLAIQAGKRFEKLVITREELPSTFGFMAFASPIGEINHDGVSAAIRAVTWTLVPQGIWFNLYVQTDDGPVAPEEVEDIRREYGYLMCPNGGTGLKFGEEILPPEPGQPNFLSTVLATWVLINQPGVAGVEDAPVDKKFARSYQRQYHRPLPPVRLVELRKRPRPNKPKSDATGREWTERRLVQGHMKRQFWGPERAYRKWIYIDDYIAGPDGAPLREPRRKVNVLR